MLLLTSRRPRPRSWWTCTISLAVILTCLVYFINHQWSRRVHVSAVSKKFWNNVLKRKHKMVVVTRDFDLGTELFSYAALLGIAERNQLRPIWWDDGILRRTFALNAPVAPIAEISRWPVFQENASYKYDSRTESLSDSVQLVGQVRSWRYFHGLEDVLRAELQFKPEILDVATMFLRHFADAAGVQDPPVFVGVHMYPSYPDPYDVRAGHATATFEFFESAMWYFLARFPDRSVIFVVCSDDLKIRTRLSSFSNRAPIAFADRYGFVRHGSLVLLDDPGVHLALLSLCNHTIIGTGALSWWVGWFTAGTVIYYDKFPTRGSLLMNDFSAGDYYPPNRTWLRTF